MRRFFQFRLRALFVLVTLAAIVALWWSHRTHCLDRDAFHRKEILRCQEEQVRDREEFVMGYAKQRIPKRSPPSHLLRDVLMQEFANLQWEIDQAQAEGERQLSKYKATIAEYETKIEETKLRSRFRLEGTFRPQRWEDQTVYDSMAQGFLVLPARNLSPKAASPPSEPDIFADSIVTAPEAPPTVEKELEEPDLVTAYEAKSAALAREIEIHIELADQYKRAIYRPWMRVDESALSATKRAVTAASD